MALKYIKNTDDATIVCKIPSDKKKVFFFRPKKIDKRNNIVVSNGFTEIEEDDLALLKAESKTFNYYFERKKLEVLDNLPHESMTSEQLIISLKSEVASLKKQIASGGSGSDENLKAKVSEQAAEIESLKKEQAAEIESLKKELAEIEEKYLKELSDSQDIIAALTEQLDDSAAETKEEDEDK